MAHRWDGRRHLDRERLQAWFSRQGGLCRGGGEWNGLFERQRQYTRPGALEDGRNDSRNTARERYPARERRFRLLLWGERQWDALLPRQQWSKWVRIVEERRHVCRDRVIEGHCPRQR